VNADDAVGRFTRWLTAYGDAWEAADAQAMASLFVVGATLQPDPFAALIRGRRAIRGYLEDLLAGTGAVSFSAEVLGAGHTYGVAHYRASGATRKLDGVLVCALDARGRCESLRQWWHASVE
jgi:hypothetical protein